MEPITAATQGISSRFRCRFWRMAIVAEPVSTSSHRSSDPSWLAHSEVIVYSSGSFRLVCSATTLSEKSCVTRPYSSATIATSAAARAAANAFWTLRIVRRSRRSPATTPPTVAYTASANRR